MSGCVAVNLIRELFLNREKILQKYPSSLLLSLPGELIFNTPLVFLNVQDSKLQIIKGLAEFRQYSLLKEPNSSVTAVVS